jgi:hypothetical protein
LDGLGIQTKNDLLAADCNKGWIPILVVSAFGEEVDQRIVTANGSGDSGAGRSKIDAEPHCSTSHRHAGGTMRESSRNQLSDPAGLHCQPSKRAERPLNCDQPNQLDPKSRYGATLATICVSAIIFLHFLSIPESVNEEISGRE